MTLFGRRAKVQVGQLTVESEPPDGLRVVFNVKRSVDVEANSADVQIWNLSETTRGALNDAASLSSRPGTIGDIILEAGLGDTVNSLMCGDRAWVSHMKQGPEWITNVDMLDGIKALSQQLSISEGPGVTGRQLVESIRSRTQLAWNQVKAGGDVLEALDNVVLNGGKVFDGSGKKALKQIASAAGLTVSIQDCELQFLKPGSDVPSTGVRLSSTSGLVGSPERYFDPENPRASLLRGEALLNGELKPGRRFIVDAENEFGIFKILQVTHSGDTHGGDGAWRTSWEAQEVQ